MSVLVTVIKFNDHCNIGNILNGKHSFVFFCCCLLHVSVWSHSHEFETFTEDVLFSCVSWSSVTFLLIGKSIVSSVEKVQKETAVSVKL